MQFEIQHREIKIYCIFLNFIACLLTAVRRRARECAGAPEVREPCRSQGRPRPEPAGRPPRRRLPPRPPRHPWTLPRLKEEKDVLAKQQAKGSAQMHVSCHVPKGRDLFASVHCWLATLRFFLDDETRNAQKDRLVYRVGRNLK